MGVGCNSKYCLDQTAGSRGSIACEGGNIYAVSSNGGGSAACLLLSTVTVMLTQF